MCLLAILMSFYIETHFCKVAMFGTSITQFMEPNKATFPVPFNTATNHGVSGNTMAQIYARIGDLPSDSTHVILEGGTNDIVGLASDAGILPNYTAILNAIPGTMKVIVMGIPQVDESTMRTDYVSYLTNAEIKRMNVLISDLCRTYSNCIPATGVMANPMVGKTYDGIHPTTEGQMEIIRRLRPYLARF
jgi:lysophospholipase L1-like esterase